MTTDEILDVLRHIDDARAKWAVEEIERLRAEAEYRKASDRVAGEREALRERIGNAIYTVISNRESARQAADAVLAVLPSHEHMFEDCTCDEPGCRREVCTWCEYVRERPSRETDTSDLNPDRTMTVEGREYRERMGKAIRAALHQCGIGVRYALAGPSELWDVADLVIRSMPSTRGASREAVAQTTAMLDAINQIEYATIDYAASSKVDDARRIDTAIAHARAVLALLPGESREAVEAAQRERDAQIADGLVGKFGESDYGLNKQAIRIAAKIREAHRG